MKKTTNYRTNIEALNSDASKACYIALRTICAHSTNGGTGVAISGNKALHALKAEFKPHCNNGKWIYPKRRTPLSDDLFQTAVVSLLQNADFITACKSVTNYYYNQSGGKTSNVLYYTDEHGNIQRTKQKISRLIDISDEDLEIIPDTTDNIEAIIDAISKRQIIADIFASDKITKKHKRALQLRSIGYNNERIAKTLKTSMRSIERLFMEVRTIAKELYPNKY